MKYELITTTRQLKDYCRQQAGSPWIAFDTEFVSEFSYWPELCLIQIHTPDGLAVVDPLDLDDLSPFWEWLCQDGHTTIVHAGREEFLFCRRAIGQRPAGWLDVQIAAGLIGLEYPAAYRTLIQRVLGQNLAKGETRTDWRRRPLTPEQLDYALLDVHYLPPLRDHLVQKLQSMGRMAWLDEELSRWQDDLEEAEQEERWRRVSGISGLNPRMLAIVRELWRWRESEAQRLNKPAKRVLRDDLIVELARRQTAGGEKIRAIRGMERRNLARHIPDLSQAIRQALDLPQEQLPRGKPRTSRPQLSLLGQFMTTAVTSLCVGHELTPSLVGTAQDVRDLITYHLFPELCASNEVPRLARGWRAGVIGNTIDELLDGKLRIRIVDPRSDHPLMIEGVT